jgi:CHAT domain-containing protein/tetratricopeptide (TPR) repeat protein
MSALARAVVPLLAITLLAMSAIAAGAAPPPPFAACDARFAAAPDAEGSAACFLDAGLADARLAPAATARLEALLAAHPGHPWLALYIGHARTDAPERALALYRAAAGAFAARHAARGEVLARANLQRLLVKLGRTGEARDEAERAEKVAVDSRDPELIARAKIVLGRHLLATGQDLERSYLLLREAQDAAFPNGKYFLKRDSLYWLGNVSLEIGRYTEARKSFQQAAEIAQAEHDALGEASARYGIARAFIDQVSQAPRRGARQNAVVLARQALAAAEAARSPSVATKAHWLLGMLTEGAEGRDHLEQCLQTSEDARARGDCLHALARHLAAADPRRAREAVREALELAHQADDPWSMAYAWRERMRVSWASTGEPAANGSARQAVADSYAALDAIEALRDLQTGTASQAELFSSWSEDYDWLAGRLLQAAARGESRDGIAQAFGVMERARARALLDALAAARAAPPATAATRELQAARATLLEEITRVQRTLFDPGLPAAARLAARTELDHLELAEADLSNQLDEANPALSVLRAPAFATLPEVQQALGAGEALLSFQIAPDDDLFGGFGGGSWVIVSTRGGTRAWPLRRDRVALRSAVELFNGLFQRRDGAEAKPAAGLYQALLADALGGLPPGVTRLVIVPDDVLHQLPFAALRPAADRPPLAALYQITVVPSATLWLRWQASRPAAAPTPLLAMADPDLPGGDRLAGRSGGGEPVERAAIVADGLRLGALPFARREGKAAVHELAGASLLRVGGDASEGFVKSADLRRFGVLHFATHAVIDDQNPERSGVLLTPAPATEDGLLQIREIVLLPLDGRVVVLSSCRSASGAVLRGEGVLGLARAFFQAGAHTVVASLWPLRDDDGAALFDRFYTHLGEGQSVAGALRAAQRDRLAEGAPAYAWAGLMVLGDGDLVPLPGGRREVAANSWWEAGGLGVLLLAAAALGVLWLRERKPRT